METHGNHYPAPFPFCPLLSQFGSPAMNWDHAVNWGRGVWVSVSVSDIGRVGRTGSGGWPTGIKKKNRKRVSCCLAWGVVPQNHPCVVNRRTRTCLYYSYFLPIIETYCTYYYFQPVRKFAQFETFAPLLFWSSQVHPWYNYRN